jgi:GT2 family glycosyltransferase
MVSIIIVNKNDRGVETTLDLLIKQSVQIPSEILVVDASNGKLNDIRDRFLDVRWIEFESKTEKKITIPEQRNVGIKAAHGNIIVFIDASCKPSKNWLANLTRPILKSTESIVAGGTLSTGKKTFHDKVYTMQLKQKYINQAPTINLAVKASVFTKVGYFDENLFYGSDMDFTWRARTAGYKILNASEALVTHDWGNFKQEAKRAYRYGQAKTNLYRKHELGLKGFLKYDFTILFYVGYVIGLPITIWFSLYPLLIIIPVIKNIRLNPLKIVAINFITAYGAMREYIH